MKAVLLTSDSLRHKYIAHCLAKQLDLALVITEKKSPGITDITSLDEKDAAFISEHFLKRKNSEEKYFGQFREFSFFSELLDAFYSLNYWIPLFFIILGILLSVLLGAFYSLKLTGCIYHT
jgi:hypothetical protein